MTRAELAARFLHAMIRRGADRHPPRDLALLAVTYADALLKELARDTSKAVET